MNFSENLKRIREDKGISKIDLAKAIGKNQEAIDLYESEEFALDYPDRDTLEALADFLEVSVEGLIGEKYLSPDRQFLELLTDQTVEGTISWYNLEETILPEEKGGNPLSKEYNQEKVDTLVEVIAELKNRPDTYNLDKCFVAKVGEYDFLLLPEGEYLISGNLDRLVQMDKEVRKENILLLDGGFYCEEMELLFQNIISAKKFKKEVLLSDIMSRLKNHK